MRLRAAVTLLLVAAASVALAAPASANCGEVGIPGKPPILVIHC